MTDEEQKTLEGLVLQEAQILKRVALLPYHDGNVTDTCSSLTIGLTIVTFHIAREQL